MKSRLLTSDKETVKRDLLIEYLVHGACYHFPAELGKLESGIPTGHSFKGLYRTNSIKNFDLVWPNTSYPQGIIGMSVKPLYPKLPSACLRDMNLYAVFAAFDLVRIGDESERNEGVLVIKKQLS
jgi:hypothetical protein